jgi:sugar/nucleoside kinase (ribokinase family)
MATVNLHRYTRPRGNPLDEPWSLVPSPNHDQAGDIPVNGLDVIGLGENSVDRVTIVPAMPGAPNAPSKMPVARPLASCGGQVATTMTGCAALGLRAAYAGAVGDDHDGQFVRDTLTASGVDVRWLHVVPETSTRSATILVDATTGERTVMWHRDPRLSLTADQVDAIDAASARVIHVDDTDLDASLRLARAAREAGRFVTTDIDASQDGAMALVEVATHAILSEHGLATLSGERDAGRGLRALRRRCDGVLCVTLGAHGSMALDGDILLTSPGVRVTPVDTTGAGDVFRAGFIRALLDGLPMAEILRFANTAAAISCTRMGAVGGGGALVEMSELLGQRAEGKGQRRGRQGEGNR